MRSVEQTGRTVEEAIKAALKLLGAAREEVEVEVLSQETRGLLGILGYSEAKVRVTRTGEAEPEPEPVSAPEPAEAPLEPMALPEDLEEEPEGAEAEAQPLEPPGESVPQSEVGRHALEVLNETLELMEVTARAEWTREEVETVF